MRILFVRSGNNGLDPITQNQGESLQNAGVTVDYFNIIGKGVLGYLGSIQPLKAKITTYKPDIVHAHYSLSGFVTALTFSGRPIVVSLMGSDLISSSEVQRIILRLFIRYAWREVIVKSKDMKIRLSSSKVHVIPNGVNMERYLFIDKKEAMKKLNWNPRKKHILFSSDPKRPEKNFDLAEKAIRLLPNIDLIEIHFLMNLSQEEMPWLYNAADCFLLTSFYEGSPNVIKEALSCNCPIVATDVGDIAEHLQGIRGTFVTGFEELEVSKRIQDILFSNQRTDGRQMIGYLDSKKVAQRIISIYESIL